MKEEAFKFFSEIGKPWEVLNQKLATPFSMNPSINDFITSAKALTVSIKHLPESVLKIKPQDIANESKSYQIISDLADSLKHGTLRKRERECKLTTSSMYERNSEAKVRFLRNRISIDHNTYGKIDFMECALESALFVSKKLGVRSNWNPKLFNNSGEFSSDIRVHLSKENQVAWTGMSLEFVQLNENGTYENVDLNGKVMFSIISVP